MESDHGDLADIVRAGGRSGPSNTEFEPVAEWQLPSEPVFVPTRTETPTNSFGDPFLNLRDPLLNQYIGAELFEGAEAMVAPASMVVASSSGHGGDERLLVTPKMLTGGEQENKGPCTVFSRVLQISPVAGNTKPSPLPPRLITPPPVGAGEMMMMKMSSGSIAEPVDNDGGVQISSPRTPGIKRRFEIDKSFSRYSYGFSSWGFSCLPLLIFFSSLIFLKSFELGLGCFQKIHCDDLERVLLIRTSLQCIPSHSHSYFSCFLSMGMQVKGIILSELTKD